MTAHKKLENGNVFSFFFVCVYARVYLHACIKCMCVRDKVMKIHRAFLFLPFQRGKSS